MKKLFLVLLMVVMASAMVLAQGPTQAAQPTTTGAPGAVAPRSTSSALTKTTAAAARAAMLRTAAHSVKAATPSAGKTVRSIYRHQCPVRAGYGTTLGPDV